MAGMTPTALALRHLQKSFGAVKALDDVTLDVRRGEFLTLLGQSGSGKSTLLMMVAGFLDPDSGEVDLDGQSLLNVPAHRRSIGVVFQSYALFPHLNVRENIGFALAMRDVPASEIERRVGRMVELMRLGPYAGNFPYQLSGGQQQRVALARALVFEPPLLLLDEPLGALDRVLREEMKLELRRIHSELGTTMVFVTHDQDEALVLSDRIAVMRQGRIEQLDSPTAIYHHPISRFVASFLGESNFIPVALKSVNDGTATVVLGDRSLAGVAIAEPFTGNDAALFLRPESIGLCNPDDGLIAALVEDIIFEGAVTRYMLRFGDQRIVAKLMGRGGAVRPHVGKRVGLRWDTGDTRLFGSASADAV